MADGDFTAFANLVDSKWPGRQVLVELLDVVQTHRNELWDRLDDSTVGGNDQLLMQKLIDRLHHGPSRSATDAGAQA
jgi:hypothetical protein